MAYQLKTTGIAANCTMFIGVDPDTGDIVDFASSAVTADLVIGANVTTSSQAWDGVTRHYWRLGSGTASDDFIAFGTNKPNWTFNATGHLRTVVWIGEVAGAQARLFGKDPNNYFCTQDTGSGGATFPTCFVGSIRTHGSATALSSGAKRIWGFILDHSDTTTAFYAADTDSAMTMVTGLGVYSGTSGTQNYDLTYIGRRNDSTSKQQDKVHAALIFDGLLSEAELDTLRDDWFGTLLESAGGGGGGLAPPVLFRGGTRPVLLTRF